MTNTLKWPARKLELTLLKGYSEAVAEQIIEAEQLAEARRSGLLPGQPDEETPAQYRDRVAEVVARHGGNKTKAGKELGISRQRVHQLLGADPPEAKATPTLQAQDPFGLTARKQSGRGKTKNR